MTLREIHERCKARHRQDVRYDAPWCLYCDEPGPCDDYVDAVAAIRALDEAKIIADVEGIKRIILDYPPDADPAPPTENT